MVLLVERGRDIQEFACRSLRCGLLFSAAISHVSNVMCMHTISTIIIPNLPIMHELQSLATHLRLPSSFQLHKRGIVRCNSLFQTPLWMILQQSCRAFSAARRSLMPCTPL